MGPNPGRDYESETGGLAVPTKVEALPVPVAAVFCGGFFTVALTKDGKVWNWGGINSFIMFLFFLVFEILSEVQIKMNMFSRKVNWNIVGAVQYNGFVK